MDVDEESVSDTASACKRQKRNNSKDETCNEDGSEAPAVTETATAAAAAANEIANSCSNNTNNNNNTTNGDNNNTAECQGKQQTDAPIAQAIASAINAVFQSAGGEPAADNNPESSPTAENPAADAAGDAVRNNETTPENRLPTARGDNDDTEESEVEVSRNLARFNRLRVLRTRSYRSTMSHSNSSSSSSNSSSAAHSDANDTEVEVNVEAIMAAANAEHESRSPPFQEESSSDSSVAFWNRYYTSSNEDVDSDDDLNDRVPNTADKEQIELAVNKVMCKSKPSYSWNFDRELMQREHNLTNRIGWRGGHTSAQSFGQGYYGSRQVVERMKLMNVMSRHRGCVNCLNFNRSGDLICSGSDDLNIIVWDWANGKPRHSFKSGHTLNIFQTKFIDSAGCLDIVSASRDGQVRRAVIPPSGSSSIKPMRLYSHNDAVHKLVVVPQSRHEVMSAGEDAAIKHFDLRSNTSTTMLRCVDDKRRVRLFSISHHPYAPEFCISGSDDKLRVYDKRYLPKSVHVMTPKDLKDTKITQITCAVYNHNGSEILASYSDAGIYLYDSRNYKDGEYLHSYEGHVNNRTIKGVNFFGPHSEYIVSGSDCGHIFFWDKNTEAVINFMKGDESGVVNCLEPHPWMPVLATSGLEHKVKIWTPSGSPETEVPCAKALKETLQRNFRRSILDVGDFDINQIQYFIHQLINPRLHATGAVHAARRQMRRNRDMFSGSSSSGSSSSSNDSSGHNDNARPANNAAAAAQEQQRNLGGNASSSDEGNTDPLGCRAQ
ncbi:hypothetical protein KR222_004397 [Zaprionus bogoriensis]|nr:hypothetical protein KR222_004397 [Zaprionus bogoriensis]